MKTKVSPAIVGAFVIGAFALGFFALLSFGGLNFLSKKDRFIVYFDESIHGLDLGSPVKLQGVRVGHVVDLNIHYDEKKNHSVVGVLCEFDRKMVTDLHGNLINVGERGELQNLIDHGLRAQLDTQSFATGLLMVELEFVDPKLFPAEDIRSTEIKYAVVPAMPSEISGFRASLGEILAKISHVDFEGLTGEIRRLAADLRKQVNSADLKGLITQWKTTGESVNTLVNSPELQKAFVNLNATLADLRATIAKADATLGTAGSDVHATLAKTQEALQSFDDTAATLRSFVNAQQGLGEGATDAFAKFSAAADAVQRLADFLERNPNALLTGRKPR